MDQQQQQKQQKQQTKNIILALVFKLSWRYLEVYFELVLN